MVFVADDLGAWLVGLLADAVRKKLTALVLGSDQQRALRKAGADAVQETAAEMNLSAEEARRLSKVFSKRAPDVALSGSVTILEGLQAAIARQLAALDDADRISAGQSPTEVLRVPGAVLAEKLTGHLVREIVLRGSGGGPLTPLAAQLNADLTHLQGQRVEGMLARLVALIAAAAPSAEAGGPARRVRVGEADPRRLGVHAAISVPGVQEEFPPEYVPRDVDTAERGVRARVAAAAQRGGFVLLVGGSSVGKTRSAVEAVKALLPDWWLVHPGGPAEVAAVAQAPSPHMVVWLDELQRYLDGEHGLTGGIVRALLDAPDPVVIVGTLWPDWYTNYTTMPKPGGADPHAREREVLDLAEVIRIGPAFSAAEQNRARAAAGRDPRLRVALEAAGYGLTQTLAAAPQLVARWEDAQSADPYAWAVLTAALDAARLGARAPLNSDFLRGAACGYLTSQQQAEAPGDWFERALVYGTGKLHGAMAALSPAAAGIGQVAGYTPADYLIQYVSRERRYARVPTSAWDAILGHIGDPGDTFRLADSAESRLLYRYAIPLYRHAADAGNDVAAGQLARLLRDRGDLDGAAQVLRPWADAGDIAAAVQLGELLAEHGDLDGAAQVLRAPAHVGNKAIAKRLVGLLVKHGDLDGLRAQADSGDDYATLELAYLLAKWGDLDELSARADAGDRWAARKLAELLVKHGDLDGAAQVLRARADAGDGIAATKLAELLAGRGDLDELRARAGIGDGYAAMQLAELLAGRGDLDELRARADAGDKHAARELAKLLAGRGDLDELRARADAGDGWAAGQLARPVDEHGDLDGLRARADAGYEVAARELARLLARRGDLDELRYRADARDSYAATELARLLAGRGDLDELRARADAGDVAAAVQLAEHGELDEAVQLLRARADAGNGYAARELARLLAGRGDLDGLRAWADAGNEDAAEALTELLAGRGDLDGLRAWADAGNEDAAEALTELLAGLGDLDGLRTQADAGYGDADLLADLLIKQGRGKEAKRLRQYGLNPDGSIARE